MPKLVGLIVMAFAAPWMQTTALSAAEPPIAQMPAAADAAPSQASILRVGDNVEVTSRIIRLKDILSPVGQPPPGWDRAASAAVALLPSDGRRLRIERQRVSESVRRSGMISGTVRVVGPEFVSVRFVPLPTPAMVSPSIPPAEDEDIVRDVRPSGTPAGSTQLAAFARSTPAGQPLLPAERNRIQRMIESAFRSTHADIAEQFEFTLADMDPGLAPLAGMRAVRGLRLQAPPEEGTVAMQVIGDGETSELVANVNVTLVALPVAVVSVTALDRGDIISARDLATKSLPRNQFRDDYVTNLQSLIGKEVVRSLGTGRPIRFDDTGEPVVIRRGDLVELKVVAGGVTVTTNAKAMAPAAAGEMIMVETDSPRRRLMARAVRSGVVEILTRPPTTAAHAHED